VEPAHGVVHLSVTPARAALIAGTGTRCCSQGDTTSCSGSAPAALQSCDAATF